jgi:hypothetical protein
MPRIRNWICVVILQTLVMTTAARAADVLNEVPRDALGFAVIRQLDGVEGKAEKVLESLGSAPAGPLALLRAIGGIEAGLDAERDLLVVLLPPENNSRQFHLAVWLPVKDYSVLVDSLEGDPERQISAVTIAGEDLLVVKHGEWAVVMDPDQRDRIERLRSGEGSNATIAPRQLAMWSHWISQNDAAVVVLPAGMRTLWSLAASEQLFTPPAPRPAGDGEGNDLFGPPQARRRPETGWPAARGPPPEKPPGPPRLRQPPQARRSDSTRRLTRPRVSGRRSLGHTVSASSILAPGFVRRATAAGCPGTG